MGVYTVYSQWFEQSSLLSCLPLSQTCSGLFSAFPGAGRIALCGMIHKVLHLFGAKSVNGAQKRTDCVCRAPVNCRGEMLLFGSYISWPMNMSRGNSSRRFFLVKKHWLAGQKITFYSSGFSKLFTTRVRRYPLQVVTNCSFSWSQLSSPMVCVKCWIIGVIVGKKKKKKEVLGMRTRSVFPVEETVAVQCILWRC